MNELLVVPSKDQFEIQAKLHREICDRLHEVVSTFDVHHSTILSQLDTSQPGQVESYQHWWQKLKMCLLQHATLHEQFAQHLETAQQNYQENEQQIASSLQTSPTTSPSQAAGHGK